MRLSRGNFYIAIILLVFQACNPVVSQGYSDNRLELERRKVVIPAENSASDLVGQVGSDCSQTDFFEPVLDFDVYQTPGLPEPPARVPFRDPVFNTCIVRLTDRNADLSPDDPSTGLKNEYSRVQSFNADGSRILVRSIDARWYVYDARSLLPVQEIPVLEEPRWDADDADLLYFIEGTRLVSYRLSTGQETLVHDFSVDFSDLELSAVWTRYEGSPSYDGRYWGLMAEDQDWLAAALLVYDLETDKVTASKQMPTRPEIDSVTISPLGNYFLAYFDEYCESGELGDDTHPCGLMVYDRGLRNGRGLLRIVGHSDLAVDYGGNEVLVFQDIDQDTISMLHLDSGQVTQLLPIDFSHSSIGFHFSGRASQTPGWVLVSTYNGAQPAATWMDDQVFALELKEAGRVVRIAHSHSIVDEDQEHDYWAEPHATVNQDFTRILFTSNWGRSGTGEIETYLIQLPEDWNSLLTPP